MDPKRLNTYYSVGHATDVTAYPKGASPYGVMDMAGNVSQWVQDDYLPYPGSKASPEVFQGRVAVAARKAAHPVDNTASSAGYRREMIPLFVKKAFEEALEDIKLRT